MGLKQKGDRNLQLAGILDSNEFSKLAGFSKEHLCSVIINRLYYGVYLLGKDKLLAKDESAKEDNFLGHGTKSTLKRIRNNEEAKESKDLWVRLKGFYDPKDNKGIHSMCITATKLHEMRNFYDYCSDVEKDKALRDLESCKQQVEHLKKKLGELK